MKKILLGLAAFFVFGLTQTNASHLAGGDIQYRYIGDSTGIAHHYEIFLRIYDDASPGTANPPTGSTSITICSSCYSTQNVTLTMLPGTGPGNSAPTLYDCVDPTQTSNSVPMDIYAYKGYAILQGVCSDWAFYWTSCCRNGAVNNITNPASWGFYIEARLNNFLGNNSSPLFVSEPVRAFCIGQTHNWKQSVYEIDGDSIYFELATPQDILTTCQGENVTFQAGFTAQQPISTSPPGSLTMNPKTGLITFSPSTQEVDVMAVKCIEYRYDTTFNQWVNIGHSFRDMQIVIAATCRSDVQGGVNLDYTNDPDASLDPTIGLPVKNYACLDSTVTLFFDVKLDCSSVDKTDFRLTRPDGQPIAIKDLVPACDLNGEALTMDVKLFKPLSQNGDYYLYSKTGNDGNTLFNKCGFAMPENDTIVLRVNNCFQIDISMENVSVFEDEYPVLTWQVDTLFPFPGYLFDEFRVYRSIDGGAYNYLTSVYNLATWEFEDKSANNVDYNRYEYKIELGLNGDLYPFTNSITAIKLDGVKVAPTPDQLDSVKLTWNSYNGWPGAEYEVYVGDDDGSGGYMNFTSVGQMDNPTLDTTMSVYTGTFSKGFHALKVIAVDPSGAKPYKSESNYFEFEVPEEPVTQPKEVVVPNIITPNNDGINDELFIDNIGTYDQRELQIYNRWGKVVFQASGYSNTNTFKGQDNSGNDLPDGVYMYVLDLNHPPTGASERLSGSITISRGGL